MGIFLIHAPMKGATNGLLYIFVVIHVSIHTPMKGCDSSW